MKALPAPMTVVMLAIFTTMVGVAATYPPGARFMPFVVGIPGIGLCLLQLVLDIYRRRTAGPSSDPFKEAEDQVARMSGHRVQFEVPSESAIFADHGIEPRERLRREVVAWGYFIGLIASILLFGFRITVPVFLIAFLRFQAGASWRSAMIYGGVGAIAMYVLFEKVLRVSLHPGFITEFILDRLAF